MDELRRELWGALRDLASRVDELEKWIETLRRCVEATRETIATHQERHEVLNECIGTLSARIDLLQPRQKNMVPCPACQDGLVFTPGDGTAEDPASHDRCQLCAGAYEVREGVAAYVRQLQRERDRWERKVLNG